MVGMCVFYLALASFDLGTSCVRCPPTQYPTNNQPPSHLNIFINNRQMRTFYVAILYACMVGRWLCNMGLLFHYLGVGSSRWSTRNQWHVCVFYLPLASFYVGTLCVRCPTTQYPTNNQPPSHLNISINNKWMRTFYVAILCACMVGRCMCSMVVLFHYLGVGGSRWSSRNDGKTCYQIRRSVAAKIGSPLESDLSMYYLQLWKGPPDLFKGFPGNT